MRDGTMRITKNGEGPNSTLSHYQRKMHRLIMDGIIDYRGHLNPLFPQRARKSTKYIIVPICGLDPYRFYLTTCCMEREVSAIKIVIWNLFVIWCWYFVISGLSGCSALVVGILR